jgi:hypothetical protein
MGGFREIPKMALPSTREASRGLPESAVPSGKLRNGNELPARTVKGIPLRDEPSQSLPNQIARHVVEKILNIPLERNKLRTIALSQPVLNIKIEGVKLRNYTGSTHDGDIARTQQRDHEVDGTTGNREERGKTMARVATQGPTLFGKRGNLRPDIDSTEAMQVNIGKVHPWIPVIFLSIMQEGAHDRPLDERVNDFPPSTVDKRSSALLPTARTRNGKVTLPLVNGSHNSDLIE